ncbi:MAG: bacteriocin [Prolixibacteraceae bacterium]|nr:bacteriocin [Prolixibacteraceae bacterium]
MNKLLQQIELIERIDQLIRLKSTGTPKKFAQRLDISEASLYRLIETIKGMDAPVEFSIRYQSYVYSDEVNFMCGFFRKELSYNELQKVNGGFYNLACLVNFNENNFITLKI